MVSPCSATSRPLPVWMIVPAFMSAPLTWVWFIARTSSWGPSSVIGVDCSVSARKPVVCEFDMLLAMTRWRFIAAVIPDAAVKIRRSIQSLRSVEGSGSQVKHGLRDLRGRIDRLRIRLEIALHRDQTDEFLGDVDV